MTSNGADGVRPSPRQRPPDDGLNTDGLDLNGVQRMIAVTVAPHITDLVSDRFWQLGVRGVSEVDRADGAVDVVSSVGNDQDTINRALATFDADWVWRVDEVSTAASDEWRRHAAPVRYLPNMLMVPAWMPDHDDIADDDIVTLVEPASAFGLGDHPTTTGSMQLMVEGLERRDVASMIDVGCGTGVLAVRAAQHGVDAIRAIDVAQAAVDATLHNAELNNVSGRIDVDSASIADVAGTYDLVVANILAPVLLALADDLVRVTAPGGTLIISGVLESRHQHVLDALAPLVVDHSVGIDGWITIALRHP